MMVGRTGKTVREDGGGFVHLHIHSNYTLSRGASTVEELVDCARRLGMRALALTDTNALYGALYFYKLAHEAGIKPIIGAVLPSTDSGLRDDPEDPTLRQAQDGRGFRPARYAVLLARNRTGYSQLCRAITDRQLNEDFTLAECIKQHQEGLIILTPDLDLAQALAGDLEPGTLFIELVHRGDEASRQALRERVEFARRLGLPVVATNAVFFHEPARYDTHRVLVAIGRNSVLEALPDPRLSRVSSLSRVPPQAPAALRGCDSQEWLCHPQQYLKSEAEMRRLFRNLPEALTNTARIAEACELEFDLGTPRFPHFQIEEGGQAFPPDRPDGQECPPSSQEKVGETPYSYLSKLAFDGLRERYQPITPEALRRLQYELGVIDQLGFCEYFLIVWDTVNYARSERIPVVGRGSAADSLVSYCLGITSVDPLAYGLYFERFLNLSRTDCPDIDLDFCWKGRDRVVRYVYDRYGADHVAMISTYNTYKSRSAFREVAKAFGLPPREVDALSSRLPYFSARGIRDAIVSFPECRDFPIDQEPYSTIVSIAETIDGFPRHLSVHVGGIVISREPLTEVTPLQQATKGIVITQLDAEPIEELGLVKIDLLGQRSLSIIADTVKMVKRNHGVEVDPEHLPDGDPQAAEVLRRGRTLGCFQIESPGMRNLLVMMRAESCSDVIKGLSLIRPGPSSSGMKERFVRRRLGLEETTYLTPQLREVLGDTHGVMLYQEDILKVAQAVAGFSLAEGDQLRKAISKERSREKIEALRERFIGGALANDVSRSAAEAIWQQITNFAEYSYCKAHATTYGHISYAAVWLKARYPAEFLASVLNNRAGFYEPRTYLEEARRWGVTILPLDINESEVYFSTEDGTGCGQAGLVRPGNNDLRAGQDPPGHTQTPRALLRGARATPAAAQDGTLQVGFMAVKGLTERTLRRLLRARAERPFRSLADFYTRARPQQAEAEALILVGAFDRFGRSRPQLLWELELLRRRPVRDATDRTPGLWEEVSSTVAEASLPELPEFTLEERVEFEQQYLEMTPSAHPLVRYREALGEAGLTSAVKLSEHVGEQVRVAGVLVASRRARTKENLFMEFITLEDETGMMEVTLFPVTYQKYGHLVTSRGPFLVEGKVEDQWGLRPLRFGALTVSAQRLEAVAPTPSCEP